MDIKARKPSSLATGGFGADATFRTIQDPRLTADMQTTKPARSHRQPCARPSGSACSALQLSGSARPVGKPGEKAWALSFLRSVVPAMYASGSTPRRGSGASTAGGPEIRADANHQGGQQSSPCRRERLRRRQEARGGIHAVADGTGVVRSTRRWRRWRWPTTSPSSP